LPPTSTERRARSIASPSAEDHLAVLVDLAGGGRSAQQGADATAELPDREGLRDVVVGAELEAEHLVQLVVASGQHDDRHFALGPQTLADFEPVELREHDVEHDEVDPLRRKALQRLLAVPRLQHAVALALQGVGEQLLNGFLVVDEEDGRGVGHIVLG